MSRPWLHSLLVLTTLAFLAGGLLPGELRVAFSKALMVSGIDGYAHLFFCALMAFMLVLSGLRGLQVLVLLLVFGASLEVLQMWVPGRSPSWADFIDDGIGALVGIILAWLVPKSGRREADG